MAAEKRMFGFFERMRIRRELKALEAAGDPLVGPWHRRLYYAQHVRHGRGLKSAMPLFEAMAAERPEDHSMAYILAASQLELGDPAGIPVMERLAETYPRMAVTGYRALFEFHHRNGDFQEAERIEQLGYHAAEYDKLAEAESELLEPDAQLDPPLYTPDAREDLRAALAKVNGLARVLAASRYRTLYREPHQIILFDVDRREASGMDVGEEVFHIFVVHGDLLIQQSGVRNEWLRDKMLAVEGSQIFP